MMEGLSEFGENCNVKEKHDVIYDAEK